MAAPTARKMPKGTSFPVFQEMGPKITEPRRAPRNRVRRTPGRPRKAPTMAIIFRSPAPHGVLLEEPVAAHRHQPEHPETHRRPQEGLEPGSGRPERRRGRNPARSPQGELVGDDVEAGVLREIPERMVRKTAPRTASGVSP